MVKRGKIIDLCCLLGLLMMGLCGTTQAITLKELIEKSEAKYAKFEKEVKNMTIVQEMEMVAPEGTMTSETKVLRKGKKFRMETSMQMPTMTEGMGAMETIIIYDGTETWTISPFMGKKKLSDKEEKKYQTERNWWELISEKAKIVGIEKVDKRICYVVEIKERGESPFTKVWLDKENLFLIKGEVKEPKEATMICVHSDFRKIKGDWEMPYKTEMYIDGALTSTILVKSIEINKGLSDDLFDPNKVKVKGFTMQEMMKNMMQEDAQEGMEVEDPEEDKQEEIEAEEEQKPGVKDLFKIFRPVK